MVGEHSESGKCDQGAEILTLFCDKFNLNVNSYMLLVATILNSALDHINHKSISLPMGQSLLEGYSYKPFYKIRMVENEIHAYLGQSFSISVHITLWVR